METYFPLVKTHIFTCKIFFLINVDRFFAMKAYNFAFKTIFPVSGKHSSYQWKNFKKFFVKISISENIFLTIKTIFPVVDRYFPLLKTYISKTYFS